MYFADFGGQFCLLGVRNRADWLCRRAHVKELKEGREVGRDLHVSDGRIVYNKAPPTVHSHSPYAPPDSSANKHALTRIHDRKRIATAKPRTAATARADIMQLDRGRLDLTNESQFRANNGKPKTYYMTAARGNRAKQAGRVS